MSNKQLYLKGKGKKFKISGFLEGVHTAGVEVQVIGR